MKPNARASRVLPTCLERNSTYYFVLHTLLIPRISRYCKYVFAVKNVWALLALRLLHQDSIQVHISGYTFDFILRLESQNKHNSILKWAISGLFFYTFVFSTINSKTCSMLNLADDWIWTKCPWYEKQPILQLSHKHCKFLDSMTRE